MGALLEWLDSYIHETIAKQLSLLIEKTGIEWKMPNGDAPRCMIYNYIKKV